MRNLALPFIKIIIALSLSFSAYAEPANLLILTNEIKTYHDSGLYEKEIAKAIREAEAYIQSQAEMNAKNNKNKKLALILDIDETSLSNYDKMVKRNFIAHREQLHKEILAADAAAIKPTLSLYNKARKLGIEVFFVTGRPQNELDATKTNLERAGYKGWSGLYLRPDDYNQPSIIPFKKQARELITKQGYTIIASIGDQKSDIEGGYLQKGFKLPNPYYYLP